VKPVGTCAALDDMTHSSRRAESAGGVAMRANMRASERTIVEAG